MNHTQHLVIDGQNLFYRGYYTGKMVDSKGRNVNGIFNYMKMLNVLLMKFRPKYCIVTWDLGKSRARYAMYPEYKAGRRSNLDKEQLENISWQINMIKQVLSALPVKQVQVMDVEADDIIGYLCKKAKGTKVVISNDRDLLQLVSRDTSIYLPKEAKIINHKNIEEFLGVPHHHYVLYKAIVGDTSDNIKGVHKMGPVKTKKFLTAETFEIKPEWKEVVDRNIKLMDIGVLLNTKEIKEIRKCYVGEKSKAINPLLPKRVFTNLKFRTIVSRYNQWVLPFRKLGN